MKLIHLSDLHLGKRVYEFSMLEDQRYILDRILDVIDAQQPQAVLIAGDVYDKATPPAEAVELLDEFLFSLSQRELHVFVISGNHDSAERIAFGGRLMDLSGIHMSPVYSGRVEPITLTDEHGAVSFYMLPFIKPAHVRRYYPEREIESYSDAVALAIEEMGIDNATRNVLITHQLVTGAQRSESEDISIGGTDNVDAGVFSGFDYVALGHLHRSQSCGGEQLRYCGTPLKYSFSEAKDEKSVTVVELNEKGSLNISHVPLTPLRDMRELKGSFDELTDRHFYAGASWAGDYLHITLTDEDDVPDALAQLRVIYSNIMRLDYDNTRSRAAYELRGAGCAPRRSKLELFAEFYELQNGKAPSAEQMEFLAGIIHDIWGDEA